MPSEVKSPFSFIYNCDVRIPESTLNVFKKELKKILPKENIDNINNTVDLLRVVLRGYQNLDIRDDTFVAQKKVLKGIDINSLASEQLFILANQMRPTIFMAESHINNTLNRIWHYICAATTSVYVENVEVWSGDEPEYSLRKIKILDKPVKCGVFFVTAKLMKEHDNLGDINFTELSSVKDPYQLDQSKFNQYVYKLILPSLLHAEQKGYETLIIPDLGTGVFSNGRFASDVFVQGLKFAITKAQQEYHFTNIKTITSTAYDNSVFWVEDTEKISGICYERKNIFQGGMLALVEGKENNKVAVMIAGDTSAPGQDSLPKDEDRRGEARTTDGMIGCGTDLHGKILEGLGLKIGDNKFDYYSKLAQYVLHKARDDLMKVIVSQANHYKCTKHKVKKGFVSQDKILLRPFDLDNLQQSKLDEDKRKQYEKKLSSYEDLDLNHLLDLQYASFSAKSLKAILKTKCIRIVEKLKQRKKIEKQIEVLNELANIIKNPNQYLKTELSNKIDKCKQQLDKLQLNNIGWQSIAKEFESELNNIFGNKKEIPGCIKSYIQNQSDNIMQINKQVHNEMQLFRFLHEGEKLGDKFLKLIKLTESNDHYSHYLNGVSSALNTLQKKIKYQQMLDDNLLCSFDSDSKEMCKKNHIKKSNPNDTGFWHKLINFFNIFKIYEKNIQIMVNIVPIEKKLLDYAEKLGIERRELKIDILGEHQGGDE